MPTGRALDNAAWKILKEEQAMLNRKVYLLDRAALAHNVFVVVYAPEATEHGDRLIQQTRIVVSVDGKNTYSGIVEVSSRSISEIVRTHILAQSHTEE